MRKLRVALVILLVLTFIALSQTGFANSVISPNGMGDALSMAKSRATLDQIQKKLTSGNSEILGDYQMLSNTARVMAAENMGNAQKAISANKEIKSAIKSPAAQGIGVPLSGIGDAIKALGSTDISFMSPRAALSTMDIPKLAVFK